MTHDEKTSGDAEQRRDELLRHALATPPISNEEIERRSKASRAKPHKDSKLGKKRRKS